jgi:hypothetical protein
MEDRKEMRRDWLTEEEALDGTLWKTLFGRIYGPLVKDRLCNECREEGMDIH